MNQSTFNTMDNNKRFEYGSFAIWDTSNIANYNYIRKFVPQLKNDLVICGINATVGLNDLENFHRKKGGRGDLWYPKAFNGSYMRGGYLTDLFKGQTVRYERELKTSPAIIQDCLQKLDQEIKDLGSGKIFIVAVGNKVFDILKKHYKNSGHTVVKLKHYSGWITRDLWMEKAREIAVKYAEWK